MFGVGTANPFSNDMGVPWMLGSDELTERLKEVRFARACRRYVAIISEQFDALQNYVDAGDTDTVKWLKWCGFTVDPPVPYGPDGLPFRRFHMKKGA